MPNMFIDAVFVFSLTSGGCRKKIFGGPGPSSFGKQLWLSEVTIEPIKKIWGAGQDLGGLCPPPALA